MLLVFQIAFLVPVISRIESIGGGRVGGGGVGSRRQVKAPLQTQRAVLCLQYAPKTYTIHKAGPDSCEEQFGTPSSPINARQSHEIHPRGFTASVKSCL